MYVLIYYPLEEKGIIAHRGYKLRCVILTVNNQITDKILDFFFSYS